MKETLKWLAAFIVLVFVSTVATLCAIKYVGHKFLPTTFDSSATTAQMDLDMNCTEQLKSLTDVFQLRQEMMDKSRIDSTFLAIDDGPLSNVVAVLLKRDGFTNKDAIVNEYVSGRAVYDNLPPTPNVQSNETTKETDPIAEISLVKEGTTSVREGPPTSVGDVNSPPSKDTVINGKHYKQIE